MGDARVGTCVGEAYQVARAQTLYDDLVERLEAVKLRGTAEHGIYEVRGAFLTVFLQVPDGLLQRGTVYQSQHFFGSSLQELAVVLCLDVHIVLPLLAIHKVGGQQAERDLLQGAFGLGDVDEIVERTAINCTISIRLYFPLIIFTLVSISSKMMALCSETRASA